MTTLRPFAVTVFDDACAHHSVDDQERKLDVFVELVDFTRRRERTTPTLPARLCARGAHSRLRIRTRSGLSDSCVACRYHPSQLDFYFFVCEVVECIYL